MSRLNPSPSTPPILPWQLPRRALWTPWVAVLLLLATCHVPRAADTISDLFQRGLVEEEANQNLDAAIEAYQAVLERHDEQRRLAATTLFRLGECYRKLGQTNEAVAQYQRLLTDFADQTTLADLSRQNLAGLGHVSEASPGQPSFQQRLQALLSETKANEEQREIQRILALLKDSPDLIHASPGNAPTPLHLAAQKGQLAVAECLLTNRANPNAYHPNLGTPLYAAVTTGHKSMTELLLANGADPNAPDENGFTPLHVAARLGFRAVAEILLTHQAKVNARAKDGWTPLHSATPEGRRAVAELLLAHGAQVEARNELGETPLCVAVRFGSKPMLELLIDSKASVNVTDKEGRTPLHIAAEKNDAGILDVLLQHQADVSARCRGETPLHIAARNKYAAAARLLLAAKADVNAKQSSGATPLIIALASPTRSPPSPTRGARRTSGDRPGVELLELLELLLQHNADVNVQDETHNTPLGLAVRAGSEELVRPILARKPGLEVRNKDGMTPLHWAVLARYAEIARLLLDAGANPNAKDSGGRTPLHMAALDPENRKIVELLLAHKAEPNVLDDSGNTPLSLVQDRLVRRVQVRLTREQENTLTETAQMLRKAGAQEDFHLRPFITARRSSRNWSRPIFSRGTNDYNRFTLLELLAVEYGFLTARPGGVPRKTYPRYPDQLLDQFGDSGGLSFPDLAQVVIHRLLPDGKNRKEIKVDVAALFQSGDCSQDVWLEWGDIVEVPEVDHTVGVPWQGFSRAELATIKKCLSRQVEVIVKGQRNMVTLTLDVDLQEGLPVSCVSNRPLCLLPVLDATKLIMASSDLSRVRVRRRDSHTGQVREMVFDCSDAKSPPDLWLRDGDVIELPEK